MLVTPYQETLEQYIAHWRSETYEGLDYKREEMNQISDLGEPMRSKSEVLIAHSAQQNQS